MSRLYVSLFVLLMVFSTAMSLVADGVYASTWWPAIAGIVVLIGFLGLGGLLVPSARRGHTAGQKKTATSALQAFGALCGAEFFTMALVTWTIGNRTLYLNNAYQALGLVIFLGLLGVGVQGGIGAVGWFLYVRNSIRMEDNDQSS